MISHVPGPIEEALADLRRRMSLRVADWLRDRRHEPAPETAIVITLKIPPPAPQPELPPLPKRETPALEADRFARLTLAPAPDGWVALADLRATYIAWCQREGLEPLPDRTIGKALSALFTKVGLERVDTDGGAGIAGIAWKAPRLTA